MLHCQRARSGLWDTAVADSRSSDPLLLRGFMARWDGYVHWVARRPFSLLSDTWIAAASSVPLEHVRPAQRLRATPLPPMPQW